MFFQELPEVIDGPVKIAAVVLHYAERVELIIRYGLFPMSRLFPPADLQVTLSPRDDFRFTGIVCGDCLKLCARPLKFLLIQKLNAFLEEG